MTDKEKLLALLKEFGIEPGEHENADDNEVVLRAKQGGVDGYDGFVCLFGFESDDSFAYVGVYE